MTQDSREQRLTPQDYADLFETDKRGAHILDDLIRRFGGPKGHAAGIDRILDTHELMGRRQVLDFIVTQINRAAGVPVDDNQAEGDQS